MRQTSPRLISLLGLLFALGGCPIANDDDTTANDDDTTANDDDTTANDDDATGDDDDTTGDDDDATGDDDDATGDDDDATQTCTDIDLDADGASYCGPDGVIGTADDDCDDTDPTAYPGAPELCDQVDNDCDGVVPTSETTDADGDGSVTCLDCDDSNPAVFPGATESCDGLDNDCSGAPAPVETTDADGDGSVACLDCDDANPAIYPGATESCDGLDNDCSGAPAPAETTDADGDGSVTCLDCDDANPAVYPGATEICSEVDDNCDGVLLPDETSDADADGIPACWDCDETDATVYPGAPELCDGLGNTCAGPPGPDEVDGDSDGFLACAECDDADGAIFPGALEPSCGGPDLDCDGIAPPPCGDDDDTVGDDDDSSAGPFDPAVLDLLAWAEAMVPALQGPGLIDFLQGSLTIASGSTCPTVSGPVSVAQPSWFNWWFTPNPWTACGAAGPGYAGEETTFSGACSAGGVSWTGAVSQGDVTSPCWDVTWGMGLGVDYQVDGDDQWLDGNGWELSSVPGGVAGSAGLSLDGPVWYSPRGWYQAKNFCSIREWSYEIEAGAQATIELLPAGSDGPAVLGDGTTELDFTWMAQNEEDTSYASGSSECFDLDTSSLNGTLTWYATTTPRTLQANLDWLWSVGGIGYPGVQYGPQGCLLEPETGTVTLSTRPSPGASPSLTVLVTFDGATSCDGCASVDVDGSFAGSWCPATGFGAVEMTQASVSLP